MRLITSINDQPSATVTEELLAIGVGVKHIANLHSIQFVVSDREVLEIIYEENRTLLQSFNSSNSFI
jgi:translation elongation factor EF-Tu-like GTPase